MTESITENIPPRTTLAAPKRQKWQSAAKVVRGKVEKAG
jgi:hypothetical protein